MKRFIAHGEKLFEIVPSFPILGDTIGLYTNYGGLFAFG